MTRDLRVHTRTRSGPVNLMTFYLFHPALACQYNCVNISGFLSYIMDSDNEETEDYVPGEEEEEELEQENEADILNAAEHAQIQQEAKEIAEEKKELEFLACPRVPDLNVDVLRWWKAVQNTPFCFPWYGNFWPSPSPVQKVKELFQPPVAYTHQKGLSSERL